MVVIWYSCHVVHYCTVLYHTLIKRGVFKSEGLLLITQEILSNPSYTLWGIFLSPAFLAVTDSTCIFSHVDHKKQKKRDATILCAAFQNHCFPSARRVFASLGWIGFGIHSVLTGLLFIWRTQAGSPGSTNGCAASAAWWPWLLPCMTKIVVNDEFGSMLCSYPGCII